VEILLLEMLYNGMAWPYLRDESPCQRALTHFFSPGVPAMIRIGMSLLALVLGWVHAQKGVMRISKDDTIGCL
jgi:hypothetical protein